MPYAKTWAMVVLKHPGTKVVSAKRVGMVYRLRVEAIRHDEEGFTRADTISPIYPSVLSTLIAISDCTLYAAPLELRNEKHWLSSARGPQFVRSLWVSTGIENVVQACPLRAIS